MSKLLPHHEDILFTLDDLTRPEGEYCTNFKTLATHANVSDVREVRRITRHLARKGYAEYFRGLTTYDGDLAGAGYCITPAGRRYLALVARLNGGARADNAS
ncbi:MAG: hypothetical protein ACRECY_03255 [Phyllobacterium sp.]